MDSSSTETNRDRRRAVTPGPSTDSILHDKLIVVRLRIVYTDAIFLSVGHHPRMSDKGVHCKGTAGCKLLVKYSRAIFIDPVDPDGFSSLVEHFCLDRRGGLHRVSIFLFLAPQPCCLQRIRFC